MSFKAGKLAFVVLASGLTATTLAEAQHSTFYEYDALGQLSEINGPGSADRRYVYDSAGNRIVSRSVANSAPIAGDDRYSLGTSSPTQVHDLRDNDSDADGHPLFVTRIFNVRHATGGAASRISLRTDGRVNIVYGDPGTTTFSYALSDLEVETIGTGSIVVSGSGCTRRC